MRILSVENYTVYFRNRMRDLVRSGKAQTHHDVYEMCGGNAGGRVGGEVEEKAQ